MKKRIIAPIFLAALCCLASCNGGGNHNTEGETRPDFPDGDRIREHICQSICDTCGGCLNYDCHNEKCDDKCGGDLSKTRTIFQAEDSKVLLFGGIAVSGVKGVNNETYVGGINANPGAELQFYFTASENVRADLYVSVCKRSSSIIFGNTMATYINGVKIGAKGKTNIKENDEWGEFEEVCIGCFDFVKGYNQARFICVNSDASLGFNFDYFALRANDVVFNLVSPDEGRTIDNLFEAETPNESNAIVSLGGDDSVWYINDSSAETASGGAFLGHIYDASLANPGKYYMTYNINANEAGYGLIYMFVGLPGDGHSDGLGIYNNELKVTCPYQWTTTGGWTSFDGRLYGYTYFKKGLNKITIYILEEAIMNIDCFIISANVNLALSN